jgi:uncharacterized protein YjbI with pentapeptide repeats
MIANMKEATLAGANLEEATLWGANLENANLEKAELRKADLDETNLKNANLAGANLQYAHLNKCNLTGADLSGAKIYGASLRDIKTRGIIVKGLDYSPKGDGTQIADSVRNLTDFTPPIEISVYLKKIISEQYLIGFSRFLIQARKSGQFQISLKSLENNGGNSVITFHLQDRDNLFFFIFSLLCRFRFSGKKHLLKLYEQLHNSASIGFVHLGKMGKVDAEEFFAELSAWEVLNADQEMITFKKRDFKSIEITTDDSKTIRLLHETPHLSLILNQEHGENAPVFSLHDFDYQSLNK